MRKSTFMGLGLTLTLAGAVAAQQPSDSARGHRDGQSGQWEGSRRGPAGGARGLLFRDIALTDVQKTQLKQLRESQRDQMRANRDAMRRQMEQARDARKKGDTAAARTIMQQQRAAMEQAREREFAAIRNILTAQQQTQFDKNVAELKQRASERGFGRGRREHGRPGKPGERGERGERDGRPGGR